MPRLSPLETGFSVWQQEVQNREALSDTSSVPYTALLPLVGIYKAIHRLDSARATSFNWRRSVLDSPSAMSGLKRDVSRFVDDLEDTYPLDLDDILSGNPMSLQSQNEQASVKDGLPAGVRIIGWNELFLARHLGFAAHDDVIRLRPLRLIEGGEYSVKHHYPNTAAYLESLK